MTKHRQQRTGVRAKGIDPIWSHLSLFSSVTFSDSRGSDPSSVPWMLMAHLPIHSAYSDSRAPCPGGPASAYHVRKVTQGCGHRCPGVEMNSQELVGKIQPLFWFQIEKWTQNLG